MKKAREVVNPVVGVILLAMWCMAVILAVGLFLAKIWLVGSLLTSGVKSLSSNCQKEYPVEVVLSGNWFCAKE